MRDIENENMETGQPKKSRTTRKRKLLENVENDWRSDLERIRAENESLKQKLELMSAKLQRQQEFTVFPLLELPSEVLLEIAAKLQKRKHRRHLMQTCTRLRALLYGRKSAELECRIPASIAARSRYNAQQQLIVDIEVVITKRKKERKIWEQTFVFPSGSTQLPPGLGDAIDMLWKLVDCREIAYREFLQLDVYVNQLFLRKLAQHFKAVVVKRMVIDEQTKEQDETRLRQLCQRLWDCPSDVTLRFNNLVRNGTTVSSETVIEDRDCVEEVFLDEAHRHEIPVLYDNDATEYEFRFHTTDYGRTITICGRE